MATMKERTSVKRQGPAAVKTVTKEELARQLSWNLAIQVVNVLDPEWYALGSIRGSKNIPLAELETRLPELDPSTEVVTYCASDECAASRQAATLLAANGFAVKACAGGIKEWKEAEWPVEESQGASGCSCRCG